MNFKSIRIISNDIRPLISFYEKITGVTCEKYTPDFAELRTPTANIALGNVSTLAPFGGASIAEGGINCSIIIEFLVDDVDKCFADLSSYLKDNIVQLPTTMPWGNRSLLIRDPDGNLVNFFTPVTDDARARFGSKNKAV